MLTPDQKRHRSQRYSETSKLLKQDANSAILTADGMCIHHWDPQLVEFMPQKPKSSKNPTQVLQRLCMISFFPMTIHSSTNNSLICCEKLGLAEAKPLTLKSEPVPN
jgi:alpha-tubulin suppressor-like RCC1 family protein